MDHRYSGTSLTWSLRTILVVVLTAAPTWGVAQGSTQGASVESAGRPAAELLTLLRGGGFNLYFRHAQTSWEQTDRIEKSGDWIRCDPAQVRQLSAEGRATARSVGEAMRRLSVPVAAVFASPYCRTVQTAEAMMLGAVEPTTDIINLRVADYFGGVDAVIETARRRLGQEPPAGSNHVYVAHGNLARQATRVYPSEGEAVVFRPLANGRFEFVGRITPTQWQELLDALGAGETQ